LFFDAVIAPALQPCDNPASNQPISKVVSDLSKEVVMALAGYIVRIKQDGHLVWEAEASWPEDEPSGQYLNDVLDVWEAEKGAVQMGVFEVDYERLS
jgi:hypothetical protein